MLEDKVILVVDDDLTLAEMYASRFKSEGAIVEVAHDGEEAIVMAEENHPHIILLDLMMPKVNGFEVLTALKQSEATKNIPVIVLTVLLEDDKYQKAKDLGANDYVIKSDTLPAEVVEKVKKYLSSPVEASQG